MEPKTLEEAKQIIADLQTQRDKAIEDKQKVIDEKKEVLKMFDQDALDNMSENEKKLAQALEDERAERAKEIKNFEDFKNSVETREKTRLEANFNEKISKVAKGDKDFEAKLRSNIDLLEKMPRTTDSEIDAIIDYAYKMTGQKETNPLNDAGFSGGGNPESNKQSFADTEQGKAVAAKLGLDVSPAEGQ